MDLIADIGATNARCALLDDRGRILEVRGLLNADYPGLEAALGDYLAGTLTAARPERAAIAIAAPLDGDEVAMTNIGWRFSRSALAAALGLRELKLLNDFEALAHALPALAPSDYRQIAGGAGLPGKAMAVLGPGSGLGVGAIVPGEHGWAAVSGEGGHVSLPAFDATEAAVIEAHGDANGHCSAERLLSGPGLVNIHATLARLEGGTVGPLTPADITARAAAGDKLATRCFEVFFALLGGVAGNLALTVGARGGVFIGGGIVPRVQEACERSAFHERFCGKGRYRGYLERIPVAVITLEHPAFVGLRAVLGRG